jgi:beta-alanine--pyruvate transaminase
MEVLQACYDAGLMVRVTGDIIAMSPPLIVEVGQIQEIVTKLADVLARIE